MERLNVFSTYAAVAVICICCYVGVFHTHHYYTFDLINWIYITITLCIVIIQMTSFEHHNHWISKLRAFLMVIFLGLPIFYTIHILQEKYCMQQLENNAAITNGKVIKLFTVRHGNSRRGNNASYYSRTYAEFEYWVGGKAWKQKIDQENYNLSVNDQIEIKYSSVEPEIFEVVGIKKFQP